MDNPWQSVFLSYSSRDREFVRELYRRLTRTGWSVSTIRSQSLGRQVGLKLEEGIDACDRMVLVLSPNFLESKWTELERIASLADKKPLPLMLQPCRHLANFPRFLKTFPGHGCVRRFVRIRLPQDLQNVGRDAGDGCRDAGRSNEDAAGCESSGGVVDAARVARRPVSSGASRIFGRCAID